MRVRHLADAAAVLGAAAVLTAAVVAVATPADPSAAPAASTLAVAAQATPQPHDGAPVYDLLAPTAPAVVEVVLAPSTTIAAPARAAEPPQVDAEVVEESAAVAVLEHVEPAAVEPAPIPDTPPPAPPVADQPCERWDAVLGSQPCVPMPAHTPLTPTPICATDATPCNDQPDGWPLP